MQVRINTDRNIDGHAALESRLGSVVEGKLARISERITRVEVHLSDVNAQRGGPHDKRCMMEARLEGRPPIAVTHEAPAIDQAVSGAADKLLRLVDTSLGRAERPVDAPG